ncbi:SsgA family sporulation/cell division regulator [Streptomyces sp. NPDC048718]|uniref:SsgA family sporulation/cell division regulator n=1 Tax=Streptomyces sp. NPDC048718 TaxID=3365587 RepID=UPI0037146C6F
MPKRRGDEPAPREREQPGARAGRADRVYRAGRTGRAEEGKPPTLRLGVRRVLGGVPAQPVRAEFRFDPASPMVVSVTFTPDHGQAVTWRIGRGLLYRGLYGESGEGAVRVWPVRGGAIQAVWLLLTSPRSSAVFEMSAPEIEAWLDATYRLVPEGAEPDTLDWDTFLGGLLDAPERPGD